MKADKSESNVEFQDAILSPMTIRGLLKKWVSYLVGRIRYTLCAYYFRTGNENRANKAYVEYLFERALMGLHFVVPVLRDTLDASIEGIEDICIAVYGESSDEIYIIERFF